MIEEFRDISGFESCYQVSNLGRVKSLERIARNKHLISEKILKLNHDQYGYLIAVFSKDNVVSYRKVHRLVAAAFIPNPENKPTVNHKDENKENNCVDNLEWATWQEQINHGDLRMRQAAIHDYHSAASVKFRIGRKKPILQFDKDGNFIREWSSAKDAQREGFRQSAICMCLRGRHKSYAGFIWKYKASQNS